MRDSSANHYERAFENWMIDNRIKYKSIDQNKRADFNEAKVKSFDFLLYRKNGSAIIAEVKGRDANDEACITSLLGEAARIGGLAVAFDFLVSAYKAVSEKSVDDDLIAALEPARESLIGAMEVMEINKPEWVVPASLQALSVLLDFLDQLKGDLADVKAGKLKPEDVIWTQK